MEQLEPAEGHVVRRSHALVRQSFGRGGPGALLSPDFPAMPLSTPCLDAVDRNTKAASTGKSDVYVFSAVQPDWWVLSRSADLQKSGSGALQEAAPGKKRGLRDTATPLNWAVAEVGGEKRPPPRYEHAAVLFRRTIYVIGGNCGKPPLCSYPPLCS